MKKIFFLLLSFIAISCSKDNSIETPADQLPPITTTGANTAGCIINGKILIPKNGSQAIGVRQIMDYIKGKEIIFGQIKKIISE